MSGGNSSQDPDYEGPVGHEKKVYQTHFGVIRTLKKRTPVSQDPNWYEYAPGKWRRRETLLTETQKAGKKIAGGKP